MSFQSCLERLNRTSLTEMERKRIPQLGARAGKGSVPKRFKLTLGDAKQISRTGTKISCGMVLFQEFGQVTRSSTVKRFVYNKKELKNYSLLDRKPMQILKNWTNMMAFC